MKIFNKKDEISLEDSLIIKNHFNVNDTIDETIIPDSIKPENIHEKLNIDDFNRCAKEYHHKKNIKTITKISAALVASFVLVFGIGFFKPSMLYNTNHFIKGANSYKQIYNAIRSSDYDYNTTLFNKMFNIIDDMGIGEKKLASSGSMSLRANDVSSNEMAVESSTFSITNEQVLNVSEGDIVKTDGEFIYAVSKSGNVNILKPNKNGTMETVNIIEYNYKKVNSLIEIYINDDKLVILTQDDSAVTANIYTLDNQRKITGTVKFYSQDGYYRSSRLTNDGLYIVTETSIDDVDNISNYEDYIPQMNIMGNNTMLTAEEICILPFNDTPSYIITTGYNLLKDNAVDNISKKAVLGKGQEIYCSTENLYVLGYDYSLDETIITKFNLIAGDINIASHGNVDGRVLNQFSADEKDNTFRIATTKTLDKFTVNDSISRESVKSGGINTVNMLTIFDENLNKISSVDNLAKGESIYSVRFLEDIAYLVTFKKTDPLFTIDLSDPKNPVVLDELKIDGFSSYLHPISDNRLLGIGKDANKDGIITGFKISLFDTTDKNNIVELDNLIISGEVSDSLVSYDHKALFYDNNKGILALPIVTEEKNGVAIFKISDRVEQINYIDVINSDDTSNHPLLNLDYTFNAQRTFLISDIFYIYNYFNISSYNYESYKYLNTFNIK